MASFELYFVALRKHGDLQFLESGPFVSRDAAEQALSELPEPSKTCTHVVCKCELPFSIAED